MEALPKQLNVGHNLSMTEIENIIKEWANTNPSEKIELDQLLLKAIEEENVNLVKYLSKYNIESEIYDDIKNHIVTSPAIKNLLNNIDVVKYYRLPLSSYIVTIKKIVGSIHRQLFYKMSKSSEIISDEAIADKLLQLCLGLNQPQEIVFVLLLFLYHYAVLENIVKTSPHNDVSTLSVFQYFAAINEIALLFVSILNEYYSTNGLTKREQLIKDLVWVFDNTKNPIEKKIESYIQSNPDIKKVDAEFQVFGSEVHLTIAQYDQILKETYNYPKLIADIKEKYPLDEIKQILFHVENNDKLEVNNEFLMALIVCHFIMDNNLSDYLQDSDK